MGLKRNHAIKTGCLNTARSNFDSTLLQPPLRRVLLRSSHTKLYYAGLNCWVSEPARAFDYRTIEQATRANRRENLGGMELILSYQKPLCSELVLPVQQAWQPPTA
jgi:hypothetical protein